MSAKITKCGVLQLNWDVHPWVFFGWTKSPTKGCQQSTG